MAETTNENEKLDITAFVDAFLNSFKKLWIVVLILTLLAAAVSYFTTRGTYVPAYKAEATVAVYSSDDSTSIDSRSAQQLGTVFPYILTSGVLKDVIMEDMGVSSLPGSIKVTNVEGTNLLTISVSSGDSELAYKTLLSIIKNYPKVAEYVVGYTVMEIVDDSGVPTDSGRTVAVQGNAMKGALFGLAAGLGLVFLHMLMYKTVRTVKDVRAFSTVDHLGSLPVYKKKKRKDTSSNINILEHNVQQDYLEAMRLIRTRVTRKLEKSGHKVIMVTSSVPGEGKSTIAANLAISLSGKSERVMLIDCDLRNPSLQEIFQIPEDHPGLMEVLEGKTSLDKAIVSFEKRGIHLRILFGSTKKATSHSEILGSERMRQIIEYAKKSSDVVVLDTPPSAMLVDAMLVAKYVDEAVYVIMSDYARASVVAEGMRELKNTGIEIGGYVLNGCKESLDSYGYHSYGYGSRYYGYQDHDQDTEEEDKTQDILFENNAVESQQQIVRQEPIRKHKHASQSVQQTAEQPVVHKHAKQKTTDEKKPAYVGKHGKTG